MLRLLLIFPQQLSKTCPLAKKILSLRQKYEKNEMILVIFLLRSEIAFFLDSWKSNFFFELFLNILVKFLITRKLVIKNFTRMFKKSSQKKFDFHSSRKKAISLRRKKMPLIISFFSYFCSRKILLSLCTLPLPCRIKKSVLFFQPFHYKCQSNLKIQISRATALKL